jgi:hypothetical protein
MTAKTKARFVDAPGASTSVVTTSVTFIPLQQ